MLNPYRIKKSSRKTISSVPSKCLANILAPSLNELLRISSASGYSTNFCIAKSSFRELNPDNLRDYLDSINDGETKSVIMSSGDYMKINDIRVSFRKIGYKFINPSLAVQ
jgi:hypothetical protein